MPTHHPMDRLHEHLEKVVRHSPDLDAEATDAVTARQSRADQERQDTGNATLPPEGR